MVLLRGGSYLRGNDKPPGNGDFYPEEGPAHRVEVSSFWIDKYEVTNAQFKEFVDATGYVAFAEKPLSKEVFPMPLRNNSSPGQPFSPHHPKTLTHGIRTTLGIGGPIAKEPVGNAPTAKDRRSRTAWITRLSA